MPRPYLVTFALSLAMVGMLPTYAHSGPNAGGTLVLHAPVPSIYTTDGGYCGSSGLTDCTGATTRFDSQDPIVVFVLASFFQDAAPRLAGVTFGLEYSDCVAVIGGESCADFELANPDWPAPGSGTAVTWTTAQTDHLIEVYAFELYATSSDGCTFGLAPHPDQGGLFADDAVPSNLDPIQDFGTFGFYTEGRLPCAFPIAACCFDDGHCEVLNEMECRSAGGSWETGEASCTPNPCPQPPTGACCTPVGGCEVRTEAECDATGHTYLGDGTDCSPNPCPQPPEGACCFQDGDCFLFDIWECADRGGDYLGDDAVCDPNPCPQPHAGACCLPNGDCLVRVESYCQNHGGEYQGDDTSCDPNPCPQPVGACCFEDMTCLVLEIGPCELDDGRFLGDGIACDPNPCEGTAGACCFADGTCEVLFEGECALRGGWHLGPDELCVPNPCPEEVECGFVASRDEWAHRKRQVLETQREERGQRPAQSVTDAAGGTSQSPVTGGCGALFHNADGTYEAGYGWAYGGVVPPNFGAFAEVYEVANQRVCAVHFDFTQVGNDTGQTLDVYVWEDALGQPAAILGIVVGVDPGPIEFWPRTSHHIVPVTSDCSSNGAWVGYWGNWPGDTAGWYVAADLDGFGGCPATLIAPGIGYPTGWNNVSIIWGPTRALGISAEFVDCGTVPVVESSWGKVKSLFR